MKKRRLLGLGGILAAAALVATACAEESGGDGDGGSDDDKPTAIDVAWNQPYYAYNTQSSYGNATANSIIAYMDRATFAYYNADSELVRNEDFGSMELVKEEPGYDVQYKINDDVVWSDGVPIDAADIMIEWAAQSGAVNTIGQDKVEYDDAGQIVPPKNEVFFDGVSDAVSRTAGQTPTIDDDGSVTFHYEKPYVDWEVAFYVGANAGVPAHVVAKRALGIEDPTEAKQAVIDAIANNDTAALQKLSNVWNTDFNFTELPTDEELYLSSGPYVITDFREGEFITLEKNDEYTWGPEPSVDTVTVRWIEDAMQAVQALKNGEVDIISPQATADLLEAAEAIDGVEIEAFPEATYEHVDINVNNGRNKGLWDDERVRQAFLKTLPRQEIVDKLIKPLNPDAEVLNSMAGDLPGFPGYEDIVAENGSADYAEVDIQGAKDLLQQANVSDPEVCILYDSANVRRQNEFQLIQESANQAGFKVTDCGDPGWGGMLTQPNIYDATLFGWQPEDTGVTSDASNYVPNGINNFYGYENSTVTDLYDQLAVATDEAEQLDLQIQIDQQLWADGFGAPIFQFPSITVYQDNIENVSSATLNPTVFWNFWEWEVN